MSGFVRIIVSCFVLAGCALVGPRDAPAPQGEQAAQPATEASAPATEVSAPATERRLPGTTIASLDVTSPGIWMRTPLVSAPMRGRVSDPASGRSVVLDLIPLDAAPGAGSRMSLAAYQSLGLPLTSLPELRVEPAG